MNCLNASLQIVKTDRIYRCANWDNVLFGFMITETIARDFFLLNSQQISLSYHQRLIEHEIFVAMWPTFKCLYYYVLYIWLLAYATVSLKRQQKKTVCVVYDKSEEKTKTFGRENSPQKHQIFERRQKIDRGMWICMCEFKPENQ